VTAAIRLPLRRSSPRPPRRPRRGVAGARSRPPIPRASLARVARRLARHNSPGSGSFRQARFCCGSPSASPARHPRSSGSDHVVLPSARRLTAAIRLPFRRSSPRPPPRPRRRVAGARSRPPIARASPHRAARRLARHHSPGSGSFPRSSNLEIFTSKWPRALTSSNLSVFQDEFIPSITAAPQAPIVRQDQSRDPPAAQKRCRANRHAP
jgi:hypothetical protein